MSNSVLVWKIYQKINFPIILSRLRVLKLITEVSVSCILCCKFKKWHFNVCHKQNGAVFIFSLYVFTTQRRHFENSKMVKWGYISQKLTKMEITIFVSKNILCKQKMLFFKIWILTLFLVSCSIFGQYT